MAHEFLLQNIFSDRIKIKRFYISTNGISRGICMSSFPIHERFVAEDSWTS